MQRLRDSVLKHFVRSPSLFNWFQQVTLSTMGTVNMQINSVEREPKNEVVKTARLNKPDETASVRATERICTWNPCMI